MSTEPVDIEFRLNDDALEASSMRAVDAILGINSASEQTIKTLRVQIAEQKRVVKDIETDIKGLQAKADAMAPGRAKEALFGDLRYAKRALGEDKAVLADMEAQLDAATVATKRLSSAKLELTDQLVRLKIAGREDTDEFRSLTREAAAVEGAIRQVNKETRVLSGPDANLQGLVGGASALAGMFSAGAGAAALLGKESKDLQAVQARLQAVMAITIGIQQAYNQLNAQSAWQVTLVAKAKKAWAGAQAVLNAQLGLGAAASKALMVSGVGLLIAGIAALVSAYQDWTRKQREVAQASLAAQREIQGEITRVRTLETVLKDSNEGYTARRAALDQLQQLMPGYNAQLSREGQLIEDNTDALKKYITQLKNTAVAKVYTEKAAAAQLEYEGWREELSGREKEWVDKGRGPIKRINGYLQEEADVPRGQGEVRNRVLSKKDEYMREVEKWEAAAAKATGSALDEAVPIEGTRRYWEERQKQAKVMLDALKDFEQGSQAWTAAQAQYDAATNKLKIWEPPTASRPDPGAGGSGSSGGDAAREAKERVAAQERIAAELEKVEADNVTRRISLEKAGVEQEIALVEDRCRRELAAIEKQHKDLVVLNGNKPLPDDKAKVLDEAKSQTTQQRDSDVAAIQKKQQQREVQARNEYLAQYGTFQEKKLALAILYANRIADAETAGDKQILHKEMEVSISAVDFAEFKQNIDWEGVFGDLDKQATTSLQGIVANIRTYMDSAGDALSLEDKKNLLGAITDIEAKLQGINPFKSLIDGVAELERVQAMYPAVLAEMQAAQEEYNAAQALLAEQEELVKEGKITREAASFLQASSRMAAAQARFQKGTTATNTVMNRQKAALQNISASATAAGSLLSGLGKAASGLAKVFGGELGNSIDKAVTLFDAVTDGVTGVIDALSKTSKTVVGSLETVVEGASGGITAMVGATVASLKTVETASVIIAIISAALSVVTALMSMFSGSKEVSQGTIDTYNKFMEVTDRLITQQKELMRTMSGVNIAIAEQNSEDLIDKQLAWSREIGKKTLKAGKGSSYEYRINVLFRRNAESLKGTEFEGIKAKDLFEMDPATLKRFRDTYPELWAQMREEVTEYGDAIIELGDALLEVKEAAYEASAQMTFEEAAEGVKDLVADVNTSAETIGSSFQDAMKRALLNLVMDESLRNRLRKWYESFSDMFKDGVVTEDEVRAARAEYEAIVQEGIDRRKALSEITGVDFGEVDKTPEKGGFETMSQDTGTELLGQFTAIRIHTANIHELLKGSMEGDGSRSHLEKIERNTHESAASLKEVAASVRRIETEGVRVR